MGSHLPQCLDNRRPVVCPAISSYLRQDFPLFSEMPKCSSCNKSFRNKAAVTWHRDKACPEIKREVTTILSLGLPTSKMTRNDSNEFKCPFKQCEFTSSSWKVTKGHVEKHQPSPTMEDVSSEANNGTTSSGKAFVQYLWVNPTHSTQCRHNKPSQSL